MITIRKSEDRGAANHGWLKSFQSFSFSEYFDPQWMGFRSLRVINEDYVAANQGFGSHPHKDMEIITYVISGQLKHKDSIGADEYLSTSKDVRLKPFEGIIRPGEIQKMSAGSGVVHSEFNPSAKEELHFLQIWIVPHTKNLKPVYEQHQLPADQQNSLFEFPLTIHQDAKIFRGVLAKSHTLEYKIATGRGVWVQMISGDLSVNGSILKAGDAAVIENETQLALSASNNAEFLLFDLK